MIGRRNRADPVGRAAAWLALAVLGVGPGPAQADTLLVVRKSAGAVDLVDPGSGLTLDSVAVGFAPHEISRSPDGRFAAVSNYGTRERPGTTLSIIDLEHPRELRRIELGEWRRPHGVAWYAPDRIALTTEEPAGLLVIDPRAGHVLMQIATGQAGSHMVAVAPDTSRAFVTNRGGGSTTVIDLASGRKLADVTTGVGSEAIALTPDGREVWVAAREAGTVTMFDADSHEVRATLPVTGSTHSDRHDTERHRTRELRAIERARRVRRAQPQGNRADHTRRADPGRRWRAHGQRPCAQCRAGRYRDRG